MRLLIQISMLVLIISACAPEATKTYTTHQDFGYELNWSPNNTLLAVTTETGLYIYDIHTFKQVKSFSGFSGSAVVFSKDYLAAINGDGLYVWSLKDYSLLFQEKTSGDKIRFQSIAISPDGKWLATGEQKQFRLWKLPGVQIAAKFPVEGFVSNLAFTDHNTLIVIEQYKAVIQEWDLRTQKMIRSFEIPRDVLFFTLSADGKVMFVDYGESGVELWNVETGKAVHYYRGMQGAEDWTRFSGDHQTAIVLGYAINGGESGMGVWDLKDDQRIQEFSTPFVNGDGWRAGALNSDGTVLAASNNEGYIYFYNVKSGTKIGEVLLPYKSTG
jgi:WD40 repeat protein